jgi:HK97 family phage major capsid protein
MNLLHRHADRRLVELTDETAMLARARLAEPLNDVEPLQRVISAGLSDAYAREVPKAWAVSRQLADALGREPRPGCIFVRVLTAGSDAAGGFLKGTQVPAAFGETGLDPDLADQLGVEKVPMTGDGAFAKVGTGFTSTWLSSETATATESTPVLESAAVEPRTVGSYFEVSRQLLLQASSAASDFVIRELTRRVRHAVSVALVNGTGANGQPTGIIGTTGVGNQSGTALAWAGLIEMMRLVEVVGPFNSSRAAWLLDPAAAKLMRTRERAAGAGLNLNNGEIGGYRAFVTTAMPAGSVLFGDFSQVVMPTWGILEVGVNPYLADGGAGFRTGVIGVRCFSSIDVAVLRPASFAKSTSVT